MGKKKHVKWGPGMGRATIPVCGDGGIAGYVKWGHISGAHNGFGHL